MNGARLSIALLLALIMFVIVSSNTLELPQNRFILEQLHGDSGLDIKEQRNTNESITKATTLQDITNQYKAVYPIHDIVIPHKHYDIRNNEEIFPNPKLESSLSKPSIPEVDASLNLTSFEGFNKSNVLSNKPSLQPFPPSNSSQSENFSSQSSKANEQESSMNFSPEKSVPHTLCHECKKISTDLKGKYQSFGNMFNVRALKPINIQSMEIFTASVTKITYKIWTRNGTFSGHEKNSTDWTLVASGHTQGQGDRSFTMIPFDSFTSVTINPNSTQAFYVTLMTPDIIYSKDENQLVSIYDSNDDLEISGGSGMLTKDFGTFSSPRLWKGSIHYSLQDTQSKLQSTPSSHRNPSTFNDEGQVNLPGNASFITSSQHNVSTLDEGLTTIVYSFCVNKSPLSRVELNKIDMQVTGKLRSIFSYNQQDIIESLFFFNSNIEIQSVTSTSFLSEDGEPEINITTYAKCQEGNLSKGQIRFALLYHSEDLANTIEMKYNGPEAIHTNQRVTIYGIQYESLNTNDVFSLENLTKQFLNKIISDITILSVSIVEQPGFFTEHSSSWISMEFIILGEYSSSPNFDFNLLIKDSLFIFSESYLDTIKSIKNFADVIRVDIGPPVTDPHMSKTQRALENNTVVIAIYICVSFVLMGSFFSCYSFYAYEANKEIKRKSTKCSTVFVSLTETLKSEESRPNLTGLVIEIDDVDELDEVDVN